MKNCPMEKDHKTYIKNHYTPVYNTEDFFQRHTVIGYEVSHTTVEKLKCYVCTLLEKAVYKACEDKAKRFDDLLPLKRINPYDDVSSNFFRGIRM